VDDGRTGPEIFGEDVKGRMNTQYGDAPEFFKVKEGLSIWYLGHRYVALDLGFGLSS
jgi:hypothetical protein